MSCVFVSADDDPMRLKPNIDNVRFITFAQCTNEIASFNLVSYLLWIYTCLVNILVDISDFCTGGKLDQVIAINLSVYLSGASTMVFSVVSLLDASTFFSKQLADESGEDENDSADDDQKSKQIYKPAKLAPVYYG